MLVWRRLNNQGFSCLPREGQDIATHSGWLLESTELWEMRVLQGPKKFIESMIFFPNKIFQHLPASYTCPKDVRFEFLWFFCWAYFACQICHLNPGLNPGRGWKSKDFGILELQFFGNDITFFQTVWKKRLIQLCLYSLYTIYTYIYYTYTPWLCRKKQLNSWYSNQVLRPISKEELLHRADSGMDRSKKNLCRQISSLANIGNSQPSWNITELKLRGINSFGCFQKIGVDPPNHEF